MLGIFKEARRESKTLSPIDATFIRSLHEHVGKPLPPPPPRHGPICTTAVCSRGHRDKYGVPPELKRVTVGDETDAEKRPHPPPCAVRTLYALEVVYSSRLQILPTAALSCLFKEVIS